MRVLPYVVSSSVVLASNVVQWCHIHQNSMLPSPTRNKQACTGQDVNVYGPLHVACALLKFSWCVCMPGQGIAPNFKANAICNCAADLLCKAGP